MKEEFKKYLLMEMHFTHYYKHGFYYSRKLENGDILYLYTIEEDIYRAEYSATETLQSLIGGLDEDGHYYIKLIKDNKEK